LELAFQEYMGSKMETKKEKAAIEKSWLLMFLIEKRLGVQSVTKSSNASKMHDEKFFLLLLERNCLIFDV
jgi:hypothetical protein